MRRGRKTRRGSRVRVAILLLILAAMAAIASAWWLALHLAALAGFVVIVAGVYYLGRRHENKRPRIGQAPARKQTVTRTASPRTPPGWAPPKNAKLTPVMVSQQCRDGQACATCPGAISGCQHDCGHDSQLIVARNRALADADPAGTNPPF